MGFWQNLVDSYDRNANILGKLYPLSTTSISNNGDMIIIIVIDRNGNFIRYDKIEKKSNPSKRSAGNSLVNITIPVTEESMGRSSGISPHPVFDQFEYLKGSGKKYELYLSRLKNFAESSFATESIKAIYKYVEKKTIVSDLSAENLKVKTFILFQVEIPGLSQSKVWEDESLFNAWHHYYLNSKIKRVEDKERKEKELATDSVSFDYITGKEQPLAAFHPKKVSNASANAKLISDNDNSNYTFRGKFEDSSQAVAIGYEASQKAHQFLRYLINDRGYSCGEQVIFSFTIGSPKKLLPPPINDDSISSMLQESKSDFDNDKEIKLRAETGFDYAEALKKSLTGFQYDKTLKQHATTAVVALDAATTGRLSITFYRELERNEYLKKIADWHESCKWRQTFWSKETEKYVPYVGAPSADRIIEAVYGRARGGKDDNYTKIKKAARERLLRCIFDGAFLPMDYVVSAVRRASNPLGITKNDKFDRDTFRRIVSTVCALIRKDYKQRNKEDYKLSLEKNRTDRDYLYGRLLGAADKLEEYALKKKENDRVVTAAIRYMQAFSQHPYRTWNTIHDCLVPYIQKVKGSFASNEIQAVTQLFLAGDYEKDVPLNGSAVSRTKCNRFSSQYRTIHFPCGIKSMHLSRPVIYFFFHTTDLLCSHFR